MFMRVLIFGGGGLVGSKFLELNSSFFEIKSPFAQEVDILSKDQISKAVEDFQPDSIINFAAFTNVEEAENQKEDRDGICFQVNAIGARNVAEVTKKFDKHLVFISTEYVFDGNKEISPYTEDDKHNPINWYGKSKLAGERFVLESGCNSVIVRISMPFSSHYDLKKDVARFFLEKLKKEEQIKAVKDQKITPTVTNDIVDALKILIENKSLGLYHISSRDTVTPLEFAKIIAEVFNLNYSLINSMSLDEFNQNKNAKLLKYSWLNPAKFEKEFGDEILHTVEEGLVIFKKEVDQLS